MAMQQPLPRQNTVPAAGISPALPAPAPAPGPAPSPAPELGEELLFSAADFYRELELDIRAARHSICLEMYIWSNDEIGRRFFALLEQAAARGVHVRLLLDGVGSFFWIRAQRDRMQHSPVHTRIYRPVELSRLGREAGLSQFFGRLNRRNHKKVALIDDRIAYAGSMNVTSACLPWKECGVRLSGPSVPLLRELFDDTWASAEGARDLSRSFRLQGALLGSRLLRSNQTLLLREQHARGLRRRIRAAKERVWLMTPYFVPTVGLFLALLRAARRGADVRLVLPRHNDVWFLRWVARLYYRYMLRAGVKIYEWLPSVLHAKVSLVDNWAAVGSSNLNRRSTYLDLELDVVLSSPESVRALEKEFEATFAASERIRRAERLGFWRNFLARLIFLWRRWL